MISIDELYAKAKFIKEAIERNAKRSKAVAVGRTSGFWQDIFDQRRIYPDVNDLLVCRRQGTILGIGDDPQGDLDRERLYASRVRAIFSQTVAPGFVASLPETSFGAPLLFEHDGFLRSANFWINAATTRRVLDFAELHGPGRPLNILELGPGWGGCVHQLHHAAKVESYTLVDLPENLYISTVHLGTSLPDRPLHFIDVDGDTFGSVPKGSISACMPGAISRFGAKFDLVLNSFSLQEMNLDSVQEYMRWILGILAADGIFVSLNSHGKAGVRLPSDYGYERFHIHHWGVFRRYPGGFYNTIPYEVVVGPRRPDSPDYPVASQDALGRLAQTGLDTELSAFHAALVGGADPAAHEVLANYNAFFAAEQDQARLDILERTTQARETAVSSFLRGLLSFVRSDLTKSAAELLRSIELGLSGFARARAELLLAGYARQAGKAVSPVVVDGFDLGQAYPEAERILATGDLSALFNHTNRVLERRPE